MKTIKKREKPIIASETELMNCRREKQSVFNFSTSSTNKRNGTKDLNRNCKENWREIARCKMKVQTIKYQWRFFNLEAENASGPLNADAIFLGKNLFGNILKN